MDTFQSECNLMAVWRHLMFLGEEFFDVKFSCHTLLLDAYAKHFRYFLIKGWATKTQLFYNLTGCYCFLKYKFPISFKKSK